MNTVAEKWLARELELNQRHEELLIRRETILSGTEAFYDSQNARAASFIASFPKARERNKELLMDMRNTREQLYTMRVQPSEPKFSNLKNNYWTMVKNVLPVWQDELIEYKRRHKSPRGTPRSDRSAQKTPRSTTEVKTPRSIVKSPRAPDNRTPRFNTETEVIW